MGSNKGSIDIYCLKIMIIDSSRQVIILDDNSEVPLYTPEGFRAISALWLQVGWDQKHLYGMSETIDWYNEFLSNYHE